MNCDMDLPQNIMEKPPIRPLSTDILDEYLQLRVELHIKQALLDTNEKMDQIKSNLKSELSKITKSVEFITKEIVSSKKSLQVMGKDSEKIISPKVIKKDKPDMSVIETN